MSLYLKVEAKQYTMPLADPSGLGSVDWANLSNILTLLWIFFPLVIIFAFSMMFAHAFIPSGVDTGLYPQKLSMLRIPLTIVGLIALASAAVLMALVIIQYPDILRAIWGQMWM